MGDPDQLDSHEFAPEGPLSATDPTDTHELTAEKILSQFVSLVSDLRFESRFDSLFDCAAQVLGSLLQCSVIAFLYEEQLGGKMQDDTAQSDLYREITAELLRAWWLVGGKTSEIAGCRILLASDPPFDPETLRGSDLAVLPVATPGVTHGILGVWGGTVPKSTRLQVLAVVANQMALALHCKTLEERLTAGADRLLLMATTDSLTGLTNRRHFGRLLAAEIERGARYDRQVSVARIDLDDFKRVNVQLGHKAGDAMLMEIAGTIRQTVRRTDITARYGEDEFALVLPEAGTSQAVQVAERIRQTIESKAYRPSRTYPPVNVTVSIGVAAFSQDASTNDALLEAAAEALLKAGREGKNRVRSADQGAALRR